ncbi:hypothetical protein, partial [Enterobacter hormaechei]
MGKLRSLFKDSDVKGAMTQATDGAGNVNYNEMAAILSDMPQQAPVTRQLARYWAKQFEVQKKNGHAYQSLVPAN